ncbi:putative glycerol-3-phosphate 2-O-acyltransferase 6-like [Capsicum annuum]|nr:putative glycerol-3-phosphate 2-O-acyltransferase 6-like [Capsicum annuum]
MDKNIPKQYRKQLCLVWFPHFVILARDVNKVIEDDLLALAKDFEKFNNYPWGYDNYNLTVKYLLTKLSPKRITLYGFPWAFMAWAFEVIPLLPKQVKDYPNEVSHPRILRWLAAKSSIRIKEDDLFNPLNDAVVHPWIVPTDQELGMTSLITLDLGASSGGIIGRVVDVGSSHPDADIDASRDDENVDAQEKINMFEIIPYTCPSHPYTNPSHPYSDSENPLQQMDHPLYLSTIFFFFTITNLFKNYLLISQYVDEILCRMRGRQLAYPDAYDATDRIIDFNFYNNFRDRYNELRKLATLPVARDLIDISSVATDELSIATDALSVGIFESKAVDGLSTAILCCSTVASTVTSIWKSRIINATLISSGVYGYEMLFDGMTPLLDVNSFTEVVNALIHRNDSVTMKRLKEVVSSSSKKSTSKSKSKKKVDDSGRPRLSKVDCGVFVAAYAEILNEGLQVNSYGFDAESQRARYTSLLWHYGVTKANEGTISDNDYPPRPRNSYPYSTDESAIITLE